MCLGTCKQTKNERKQSRAVALLHCLPTLDSIYPPDLVQLDTLIVGSTCLCVGGRVLVVVVTSQPVLVDCRRRRDGDRVIVAHIIYIVDGWYSWFLGGTCCKWEVYVLGMGG
jgi:hypothetical protein